MSTLLSTPWNCCKNSTSCYIQLTKTGACYIESATLSFLFDFMCHVLSPAVLEEVMSIRLWAHKHRGSAVGVEHLGVLVALWDGRTQKEWLRTAKKRKFKDEVLSAAHGRDLECGKAETAAGRACEFRGKADDCRVLRTSGRQCIKAGGWVDVAGGKVKAGIWLWGLTLDLLWHW